MPNAAELAILIRARDMASKQIGKIGKALDGLKKAAQLAMVAGVAALAGIAVSSVNAASDLGEAVNKANVVFGDSVHLVEAFAETSANAFGISKRAANEYAGTLGIILTGSGLAQNAAAAMSVDMVKLAADMASFNNIPIDVALEKIRAGLVGETEPLRTVGVLLNEAAVKEEAYAAGIAATGAKLTDQQKVQARYNIILEQTAVQQGDFANTADSMANASRRVGAIWEDIRAELGQRLLPAIEQLINAVADNLPAAFERAERVMDELSPIIKQLAADMQAFGNWVINNRPALVAAIVAIGIALSWALPGGPILQGIGLIIAAVALMRTDLDELGVTGLKVRVILDKLAFSFITGAQAAANASPVYQGLKLFGIDPLGDAHAALEERVRASTRALVEAKIAAAEADAFTQFQTDNMAQLITVMDEGELAIKRFVFAEAARRTETALANASATQSTQLIREGIETWRQATTAKLIDAQKTGEWSAFVQQAAAAAGVSVDVYRAKLALAAQVAVVAAAAHALFNSSLSDLGGNLQNFVAQARLLPGLIAELKAAVAGGISTGPGGLGPAPGAGSVAEAVLGPREKWIRAGQEIAEALATGIARDDRRLEGAVEALLTFLDRVPAEFRDAAAPIADVIQKFGDSQRAAQDLFDNIVKRGFVTFQDLAQAVSLGAVDMARDFAAALRGESSEIGAAIFERTQEEAAKAAQEAAEEFNREFQEGLKTLESEIGASAGRILDLIQTETREAAFDRLQLLRAELELFHEEERIAENIGRVREHWGQKILQLEESIARRQETIANLSSEIDDLAGQAERAAKILGEAVAGVDVPARTLIEVASDLARARESGSPDRFALQREFNELEREHARQMREATQELRRQEVVLESETRHLEFLNTQQERLIEGYEKRKVQLEEEIDQLQRAGELRDKQAEITSLWLQLSLDLIPTRDEVNKQLEDEIVKLEDLREIQGHINEGIFETTDAFILMGHGLDSLAQSILRVNAALIAGGNDPAGGGIGGESLAAGGGDTYIMGPLTVQTENPDVLANLQAHLR